MDQMQQALLKAGAVTQKQVDKVNHDKAKRNAKRKQLKRDINNSNKKIHKAKAVAQTARIVGRVDVLMDAGVEAMTEGAKKMAAEHKLKELDKEE